MTSDRDVSAEIVGLAQTGEGVASIDGRRVLVPGTMPGDRVRLEFARDRVASCVIEAPSTQRLAPPCAIVDECGGCTWQHVPADVQRDARIEQLRRSLPPALRSHAVEYVGAEARYGYRTRARLAWSTQRGEFRFGFRGRSSHDIVDLVECPVLVPALDHAIGTLRDELTRIGGSGELGLAVGESGAPVANVRPDAPMSSEAFELPSRLFQRGFAGAALWPPGATAPALAGDPHPIGRAGDGAALRLGLEGFAQANEALNEALANHVAREAKCATKHVMELYAGAGNFTVVLAKTAARVTAIESERDAVEAMRGNLAARGLSNVSATVGTSEQFADRKADVVVLDPPRTGAREVCEILAKKPPTRVVYVSCDAATLGRDLGNLGARKDVERLTVFEMLPQTPHLETDATLIRR